MKTGTYKHIKVLVLSEIKYNLPFLLGMGIFFIGYAVVSLFDVQLFTGSQLDTDFWGGLFSFFFYLLIYAMWIIRVKEKRLRLHSALPVTLNVNAVSRTIFIVLMILTSFLYITVMLVIVPSWSEESGSILAQIGFVFIVFSLFIIGRDLWYFNSKKISGNTAIVVLIEMIMISLSSLIFIYVRPFLYDVSGAYAGRAVFTVWAFFLTMFTIYTLKKRDRYLA
jgi:hypothetical protein